MIQRFNRTFLSQILIIWKPSSTWHKPTSRNALLSHNTLGKRPQTGITRCSAVWSSGSGIRTRSLHTHFSFCDLVTTLIKQILSDLLINYSQKKFVPYCCVDKKLTLFYSLVLFPNDTRMPARMYEARKRFKHHPANHQHYATSYFATSNLSDLPQAECTIWLTT